MKLTSVHLFALLLLIIRIDMSHDQGIQHYAQFSCARSFECSRVPAAGGACARRVAAAVRGVRAGDGSEERNQPRASGERRAQHRRDRRARARNSQAEGQVIDDLDEPSHFLLWFTNTRTVL